MEASETQPTVGRQRRRAEEPQPQEQEQEGTHFDYAGNPVDEEEFYCPGCGRRYSYMRECTGYPAQPHPPIQLMSTDELRQDPDSHTAAPGTENLG